MLISQFIIAATFIIALCLGILCNIILRLTLDRRVRKALSSNKIYDGFFDGFFGMLRSMLFANACIPFMKGSKNNMKIYYNDFDVASFANRFERIMAYIQFICLILMAITVITVFITEWLNIFEWSDA